MPAAGDTTARGYGAAYQRDRARLLASGPMCWRGCGRLATTADHVPPLATHRDVHVHGSGCCQLLPACAPCNLEAGARLGAARRRRPSRWLASSSVAAVLGARAGRDPAASHRLSPEPGRTRPDRKYGAG